MIAIPPSPKIIRQFLKWGAPHRNQPQGGRLESPRRFYRPELDLLRFIAFSLVFLHHIIPPNKGRLSEFGRLGALGMPLFFVLSSFLITELLRLERERTGTIRMRAFYLRRILRIWPLYFAFLALAVLLGTHPPFVPVPARAIAFMLLLAGNWYVPLHGYLNGFIGPLWSISLEEQFYLLWPTLCRFFSRTALIAASALLMPLGAAAIFHLASADRNTVLWVNSFVQFQMFGAGALLALQLRGRIPAFTTATRALLFLAGATACYAAQMVFHLDTIGPGRSVPTIAGYLCAAAGACCLLLCLLGARISPRLAPIVYLGKISYGLYIFHLFFIDAANLVFGSAGNLRGAALKAAAALAATIAAAALSYRFLESPFIRLKERFAVVPSRGV